MKLTTLCSNCTFVLLIRIRDMNLTLHAIENRITNQKEKRKHLRFPANWIIQGQRVRKELFSGITFDLSISGLSIYSSLRLNLEEKIFIKIECFFDGKRKDISIIGVVKNTSISNDKYRCGIEFVKLSRENHTFLCQCIAKFRASPGKF